MFDFVHGNEYVLFGNQSTANYLMNFRVHFALKTCVNVVFSKRGGRGGGGGSGSYRGTGYI
jgi:hypothetical protein